MGLGAMLREWRETEKANQQGELRIQAINEQTKQRNQEPYTPEALASLDSEVESYLLSHGFEKTTLSWLDDVFGTIRRHLKENPAYVHRDGYVFQINTDPDGRLDRKYIFAKTKKDLSHAQAVWYLRDAHFIHFDESSGVGGVGGAVLGGIIYGNIPGLATRSYDAAGVVGVGLVLSLIAFTGALTGAVTGQVYNQIMHTIHTSSLSGKKEDLTCKNPYETVEKLMDCFGEIDYNKAGITDGGKNENT